MASPAGDRQQPSLGAAAWHIEPVGAQGMMAAPSATRPRPCPPGAARGRCSAPIRSLRSSRVATGHPFPSTCRCPRWRRQGSHGPAGGKAIRSVGARKAQSPGPVAQGTCARPAEGRAIALMSNWTSAERLPDGRTGPCSPLCCRTKMCACRAIAGTICLQGRAAGPGGFELQCKTRKMPLRLSLASWGGLLHQDHSWATMRQCRLHLVASAKSPRRILRLRNSVRREAPL